MDVHGNPRKRQTAIVDDDEALARANTGPNAKRVKHGDGDSTVGARSRAAKVSLGSKATAATASTQPIRFNYQGVQITVPRIRPDGKRAGARAATTVEKKHNKNQLLAIVEKYAGLDERDKRREDGNNSLAKWISAVENIAFGSNGKDKKDETTSSAANSQASTPQWNAGATEKVKGTLGANTKTSTPKSNPRAHGASDTANHDGKVTAAGASLKNATASRSNKDTQKQQEVPALKGEKKRKKNHKSTDDSELIAQEMIASLREEPLQRAIPPAGVTKVGANQVHPLITNGDLIPLQAGNYDATATNHTKIVHLPEIESVVILSATSSKNSTAVQRLVIPTHPEELYKLMHPSAAEPPTLAPGHHGGYRRNPLWSFERDPSLDTGVGHQIDPADQERLIKDPSFWAEFDKKYPGDAGHGEWRCGCPMTDDGWSEEE